MQTALIASLYTAIGNTQFKKVYKSRVPHTFRVATEGDAITSILTVGKGFSGIYRHAGLEVLLEDGCTGNILVGPTGRSSIYAGSYTSC